MRFHLVSRYGDGLALLHRLQKEGHTCTFSVEDAKQRRAFQGMIPQTTGDSDLVLFDMCGMGQAADSLRSRGQRVYGASRLADSLEMDRKFMLGVAKANEVKVPEFWMSPDLQKDRDRLNSRVWVFKAAKGSPSMFAVVPRNQDEQTAFLDWLSPKDVLVQEKIPGVDISIGCFYFEGQPIVETMHSAIEFSRFMPGGVGPVTGSMGCLSWFWRNKHNKLWRLTHEKLGHFLAAKPIRYTGPLTLRTCVSEKDQMPYLLEVVCRLDTPVVTAISGGLGITLGSFLDRVSKGAIGDFNPVSEWCASVRVTIPPYPNPIDASHTAGQRIANFDESSWWPMDVRKDESGYVTAGVDGVVCDLTAMSSSLPELEKDLMGKAERLTLLDKQYRTDIVSSAATRLEKLREWKYIQ